MRESSQKLYKAVEQAIGVDRGKKASKRQQALLRRIGQDYYHDYFGVPAFSTLALVNALYSRGLGELVERVKQGEFDATPAEADEWARSPEGQAAYRALMN